MQRQSLINKKTRERNRRLYAEYRASKGCSYPGCNIHSPDMLDLDHQRDKVGDISRMIQSSLSWKTIQQEIDKCVVLCANHHRKKTAQAVRARLQSGSQLLLDEIAVSGVS